MAEVGTAFVSVIPSAKGFGKKLDSQVGPQADRSGKAAGKRFGSALNVGTLAKVAATGVVAKFFTSTVGAASDLAENQSKVGVVFGKSAGQIMAASRTSAKAMGLSKNAYLDATGTLGNLLVSLDIAPKKAAGMSQQMVKLAGDLASFNNVSPEEALDAIKSGLTGETEPLKQFGVNMNAATLQAQALKMGLIKSTKEALTPQTQALAAQALIMAQTKTAQGDFARTSGGLANQQRILKAQFEDVKAVIGAKLLPIVTKVVTKFNDFIKGMQAGTGAGGRFAYEIETLAGFLGAVFGFISNNKAVVGTFVGILLTAAAAAKTWAVIQAVLNAELFANPIGLVVLAVAALAAGLVYAYKHSETFRNIVDGAFAAVKKAGQVMGGVLRAVFGFIVRAWVNSAGFIVRAAAKAFGWVPGLGPKLRAAAAKFEDFRKKVNRELGNTKDHKSISVSTPGAGAAISSLATIKRLINDIKSAGPVKKPASNLGGLLGGKPRAKGGPVSAHTSYLVGERGPEIFTPPRNGRIIPNNKIGGGSSSNVNFNGPIYGTDPVEVARVVGRKLDGALAVVAAA